MKGETKKRKEEYTERINRKRRIKTRRRKLKK
jgi:hypothetical protein